MIWAKERLIWPNPSLARNKDSWHAARKGLLFVVIPILSLCSFALAGCYLNDCATNEMGKRVGFGKDKHGKMLRSESSMWRVQLRFVWIWHLLNYLPCIMMCARMRRSGLVLLCTVTIKGFRLNFLFYRIIQQYYFDTIDQVYVMWSIHFFVFRETPQRCSSLNYSY